MNKISKISIRVIVLALCFIAAFAVMKSADSKIITNVPADLSGEEIKAIVIEDFENLKIATNPDEDGWLISSYPKAWSGGDENLKKVKNPVLRLEAKAIGGGPNDLKVEDETSPTKLGTQKNVMLGVRFKFRYPGSNSVSLDPPKEVDWKDRTPVMTYNQSLRQEVQERGIQLPGRAKALSMWVHGRGFPYTIEVWIRDHKGDVHVLPRESINFVGWQPIIFKIPENIPQSTDSYPATRVTKLVKIVVREVSNIGGEYTRSSVANSSDIYFFIDQIKVLTDTYEVYFDGIDLHKTFDGKNEK
jgi:hypothetical protein